MLRYSTDRARPGLVALYDIWPGNGVGQFLQPWSPHGASGCINQCVVTPSLYWRHDFYFRPYMYYRIYGTHAVIKFAIIRCTVVTSSKK